MANFYTAKKTIKGKEYTAQFNGISAALEAIDNAYLENSSNTSSEKLGNYIFENVIVEPKMSINDFGAEKIGETKTKTINGKEYTAKFSGMLAAVRAIDNSYIDGSSNTSNAKLSEYLLGTVITSPENLKADDFGSMNEFQEVIKFAREAMQGWGAMDEYNEVTKFGREVMQGNFRNEEPDQKPTNKESKK